jgi:hypothetical protein
MKVAARFQINILIEPIPKFSMYEKVQRKFIPVLWFEQRVKMNDEILGHVKILLGIPNWGETLGVFFVVIGIIQIIIIPLKHFFTKKFCEQEVKTENLEVKVSPEVFPLLHEKHQNGVILIGQADKIVIAK